MNDLGRESLEIELGFEDLYDARINEVCSMIRFVEKLESQTNHFGKQYDDVLSKSESYMHYSMISSIL